MALIVSTNPPELIVRTKRKKVPMRRDDTPFLCDRFWECVLNDYVEEFDSEDDIVARSPSRSSAKVRERSSRRKKVEKNRRQGDVLVEISKDDDMKAESKVHAGSAKYNVEPETAESNNDHEMDHRETDIVESPHVNDSVESDPKPPIEVIVKQSIPDHPKNRYRKLDTRISGAPSEPAVPSKLGKGLSNANEYRQEEDADQPTEIRKKGSGGEVIHYAPQYLQQQGTTTTRPSRSHGPPLPESRSTKSSRRVAVDPDEHRPSTGRIRRSRDVTDPDPTQSSAMNYLPRGPSNARGSHPLHSRSTDPRNNVKVHSKHDGSRVETIDLTNQRLLEPIQQNKKNRVEHDREDAHGKFKSCEETVNWMLHESKKAESDYRRRKLDRKEALDRIRAIKARLQTVDP